SFKDRVIALRREMWLRAAAAHFFRHAGAVVTHFQNDLITAPFGPQNDAALPRGGGDERLLARRSVRVVCLVTEANALLKRGVARIEKQVLDRLLNVRQVSGYQARFLG